MTASTTIPIESTPTSAEDLWFLAYLLRANWKQNITVRSSFETQIKHALSSSEQRYGLRGRPVRNVLTQLQALSDQETFQMRAAIMRASIARSLVPLFSDQTITTAAVASLDTVIPCDTTLRRFNVGARVVIFDDQSDPAVDTFDVREIGTVASNSLTLTAGVTNAYLSRAVVLPLIEAEILFQQNGQIHTDHITSHTVDVVEVVGDSQLPVTSTVGTSPAGLYVHDSIPLLEADEDFNRSIGWSVNRDGGFLQSGIGSIAQPYGSRGRIALDLPVTTTTRQEAWDIINFFDSRGGRLHPFWLMFPTNDLSPLRLKDANGSGIVVTAVGAERDWDDRPYIGIIANDGTRLIRTISSVSRSAGEDTLNFDTDLDTEWGTPDIDEMSRCSLAYKCRFNSDELVEQWQNDQVMTTSLKVTEVLEEKAVTVSDLAKITTEALGLTFIAGDCSAEIPLLFVEDFSLYEDGDVEDVTRFMPDGTTFKNVDESPVWKVFYFDSVGNWHSAPTNSLKIESGRVVWNADPPDTQLFAFGCQYYNPEWVMLYNPTPDIDISLPLAIEAETYIKHSGTHRSHTLLLSAPDANVTALDAGRRMYLGNPVNRFDSNLYSLARYFTPSNGITLGPTCHSTDNYFNSDTLFTHRLTAGSKLFTSANGAWVGEISLFHYYHKNIGIIMQLTDEADYANHWISKVTVRGTLL